MCVLWWMGLCLVLKAVRLPEKMVRPDISDAHGESSVQGVAGGKIRVVIVTNIPAPYRLSVYALLAQEPDIDLHVVYCSGREPDREWNLGQAQFAHTFLNQSFVRYRGRFIHVNHDVWSALLSLKPDIVVTTGFNPTHLLAYAWARMHGARHVALTDGTLESEANLTTSVNVKVVVASIMQPTAD